MCEFREICVTSAHLGGRRRLRYKLRQVLNRTRKIWVKSYELYESIELGGRRRLHICLLYTVGEMGFFPLRSKKPHLIPQYITSVRIHRASSGMLAWWSSATEAHTARARLHACGVVRLSLGATTHRRQAPWVVLPGAMQREQPISLVRSLSALIEHRVWQARVVWSSATGPHRARLPACVASCV